MNICVNLFAVGEITVTLSSTCWMRPTMRFLYNIPIRSPFISHQDIQKGTRILFTGKWKYLSPFYFFPFHPFYPHTPSLSGAEFKTGQISLHVWKGQKNGAKITLYTVLFKVQHYEKTKNIMQCKLQLQWWNYFGHYQWCSWTCLKIKLLKCLIPFQAEMWIKTVPNNLVHFLQIFERSFRHSVFLFFCCLVELPLRLNAVSFPLSRTWPTWETESNRTN